MGVMLAWAVVAGIQTVRDLRYQGRAPLPSEYVSSGALYGALAVLSGVSEGLATALGWGFLAAVTISAGGPSQLVQAGFPGRLGPYFSPDTLSSGPTSARGTGTPIPRPGEVGGPPKGGCEPFCGHVDLIHRGNVALAPEAMDAYLSAQHDAGSIVVVSSYRSCASQVGVCIAHGCRPPDCCPGTAAPVGRSCHQRGLAIDVSGTTSGSKRAALVRHGFRGIGPSDPNHYQLSSCPC